MNKAELFQDYARLDKERAESVKKLKVSELKTQICQMILSMGNEDYLNKAYHYILAKHSREKGGAE